MLPNDKVLHPYGFVLFRDNAARLQGTGPVTYLRMIKYGSTALGQNREKKIALPKAKEEFAVGEGISVLQVDGTSKLSFPFPHPVNRHRPFVSRGLYDRAGKYILGSIEPGRRRSMVARARCLSAP